MERARAINRAWALCGPVERAVFSHFGEYRAVVTVGCFPDGPSGFGVAVFVPGEEVAEHQALLDIHFADARMPVRAISDAITVR